MIDLGEKLKNLRKQGNLTQVQLAENFGIGVSAVSAYESGYRYPSYDILVKYSRRFHVTTDYLLGIAEKPMPENFIDVGDLTKDELAAIHTVLTVIRKSK